MPGPTFLRGEAIDLHTVETGDLEFLHRVINDPDVWRQLSTATPKRMTDEEAWYEATTNDREAHMLICDSGDPVGIVGLNDIEPTWGIAELGYYVDPEAHGEGYATEAVELMVEYAFRDRRLEKVFADAIASNAGSRRVLEKNGFRKEGQFREHAFVNGERVDVVRYGLLEGNWRE